MSERHKRIHQVNTDFRAGETEDETVITIETSPALMPPPWVNFRNKGCTCSTSTASMLGLGESSSCRRRTPLSQ